MFYPDLAVDFQATEKLSLAKRLEAQMQKQAFKSLRNAQQAPLFCWAQLALVFANEALFSSFRAHRQLLSGDSPKSPIFVLAVIVHRFWFLLFLLTGNIQQSGHFHHLLGLNPIGFESFLRGPPCRFLLCA